jgi:signal peptidase I
MRQKLNTLWRLPSGREAFSWVLTLAIAISVLLATQAYAFQPTRVKQTSMYPTLHDDDIIFLDKLSLAFSDVKRGDIVVFRPPFSSDAPYIKRVIGLPGETVSASLDDITINGMYLPEDDDETQNDYQSFNPPANPNADGVKLTDDEYFMVGDNRGGSYDSRSFGPVKRKEMLGKATAILWPAERIRKLK